MKLSFWIFFISYFEFNNCQEENEIKRNEDSHLVLTPLLQEKKFDEARNLAAVPEELFLGIKSFSGFLTVDENHNSNSFFWFIPATKVDYKEAPLILWLAGGPGGSSISTIFEKNGPFEIDNSNNLLLRNASWNTENSVLYIDNPVGSGFSYTDRGWRTTDEQIAEDLYNALIQFFQIFPELQKNDFYISGHSYAGKYITSVSYTIHKKNPTANLKINLKGLCIGNGLVDPANQINYGDYLYQIGLIDSNTKKQFDDYTDRIKESIETEEYADAFSLYNQVLAGALTKYPTLFRNATGLRFYYNYVDNRIKVDFKYKEFLDQFHYRKAIHVGNKSLETDKEIVPSLVGVFLKSVAPRLSELLNHYRVLIFNGQLDIIVGYPLTVNYLRKLNFKGAKEYKKAPRHIWMENGEIGGYVKEAGLLTEVLVRNAGHAVINDQPYLFSRMINKFARNLPIY